MANKFRIDRRTHLKGLGAALALPLLETMGWSDEAPNEKVKPPVRLGFMYMPHGVIPDQFWPADAESFLTAPPSALESLKPVLDQCLLMKGNFGRTDRAVQWRAARARALDLAHRATARCGPRADKSTLRYPRTRSRLTSAVGSPPCARSSWPRCRRRTKRTRKA